MDDQRLEQLERDLADLRKDFGAISDTLKDLAESRAHGPGDYACAWQWARDRFKQSKDNLIAHPVSSAAVLIGIGVVIGLLISRH